MCLKRDLERSLVFSHSKQLHNHDRTSFCKESHVFDNTRRWVHVCLHVLARAAVDASCPASMHAVPIAHNTFPGRLSNIFSKKNVKNLLWGFKLPTDER